MPEPTLTPEQVAAKNEETARTLANQGNDFLRPASPDDFKSASEGLDTAAKEAEQKALKEKADGYFKDSPTLPPNASPKSSEAFEGIKIRATQEITAKETEIEKLKKDIAERDEKLKNPVPPEVEKEIKELREWRAKIDVDADPKFKEFDKNADNIREFVYDQLRKSPNVSADKLIEKIKTLGGPEMVDWTKIFESLKDPTLENIIKSKVSDIELIKFNKAESIKTAKKNIEQYITDKNAQSEKSLTARRDETKSHLDSFVQKLGFLKPVPDDPKADSAKKSQIEEHNKWVAQVNENIQTALNDDTPETRALMIAGVANLMYLNRIHDGTVAENESLKKENATLKESIAKFKGASVNRIREGGAPASGDLPKPKTDEEKLFKTPATQALDDLAKDIMAKRAAAGQ